MSIPIFQFLFQFQISFNQLDFLTSYKWLALKTGKGILRLRVCVMVNWSTMVPLSLATCSNCATVAFKKVNREYEFTTSRGSRVHVAASPNSSHSGGPAVPERMWMGAAGLT